MGNWWFCHGPCPHVGYNVGFRSPDAEAGLAVLAKNAILLNLITLGVNSGVASGRDPDATTWIVFFTFVFLVIVVNFVVVIGLLKGKETRIKLINGLLKMYKDQGVEGYYDVSLLSNYSTRYNLFLLTVVVTGLIAVVVPSVLIV